MKLPGSLLPNLSLIKTQQVIRQEILAYKIIYNFSNLFVDSIPIIDDNKCFTNTHYKTFELQFVMDILFSPLLMYILIQNMIENLCLSAAVVINSI